MRSDDYGTITIKIRVEQGCFCPSHSPEVNSTIELYKTSDLQNNGFEIHEHESGPEIIAWLALGTAGLTVAKSVIDLVTSIINACNRGKKKGDNLHGKLILLVRDTHRTRESTEEIVLEIYDKESVSPEIIKQAIESGINRKTGMKE